MKSISFYPPTYWMSSLEDLVQINTYDYFLFNYKESLLVNKIFKQDKKIKHRTNEKHFADAIGYETDQFLISISLTYELVISICILNLLKC